MNKKKELRKLTWRYFLKGEKQDMWTSIKENYISHILGLSVIFIAIVMISSILIATNQMISDDPTLTSSILMVQIVMSFLVMMSLAVVSASIIYPYISRLRRNWEWAIEDADYELRRRNNRR